MGKGSGAGRGARVHHRPRRHVDTSPLVDTIEFDVSPKGLRNVGNTCYANAALQCLLSTALTQALLDPRAVVIFRRYSSNPSLLQIGSGSVDSDEGFINLETAAKRKLSRRERRRKQEEDLKIHEDCEWLTRELTQITEAYVREIKPSLPSSPLLGWLSSAASPVNVVDPSSITKHPDRLSKCLRPYRQEDAHEFLRALLSTLVMNGQNRRLSSLFDGLLESAVTCQTCSRTSLTRDRYMDLSLDICDFRIQDLHNALTEYTKTEVLDGDNKVFCQRCQTKRKVTKGLRLATAPSILVCHIKRFAWDDYGRLIRLNKKIAFPPRLEIGDYMSKVNKSTPPPYDLVAVLVHQGRSCDSGHYLAYVRYNGDWYQCSDSDVSKVDTYTVMNQQAYILIYEVAGMREKNGFHSYRPSKRPPQRSRASSAENPEDDAPFLSFMSLLRATEDLNETVMKDLCCNVCHVGGTEPLQYSVSAEEVWRHGAGRDDTTVGESTVSSSDTRYGMRRRNSFGTLNTLDSELTDVYRRPLSAPGETRERLRSFANSDPGGDTFEKPDWGRRNSVAAIERSPSRSANPNLPPLPGEHRRAVSYTAAPAPER